MAFDRRAHNRAYYLRRQAELQEAARERAREKYPEQREAVAARATAWNQANPDRRRAIVARHQARPEVKRVRADRQRRRNLGGIEPLVVLELHDGICGICGADVDPLDFHVDHRFPLARGGDDSYENTQPAHPVCNLRKGARV